MTKTQIHTYANRKEYITEQRVKYVIMQKQVYK